MALTIKIATGIERFQDSKGFGNWFIQLVKSRDSCQPDQAVEPSAHLSESESKSEDAYNNNQGATAKQFIPIKTKKDKKDDLLKSPHMT